MEFLDAARRAERQVEQPQHEEERRRQRQLLDHVQRMPTLGQLRVARENVVFFITRFFATQLLELSVFRGRFRTRPLATL